MHGTCAYAVFSCGIISALAVPCLAGNPDPEPFTEEAVERGVLYEQTDYPVAFGHQGYGVGFADLDNDGDLDLILLGKDDLTVGLFENDGTGHFTDRSAESGIAPQPENCAFSPADYDGDGDLDLYITNLGEPNALYMNVGDFTFTDVSEFAGVAGTVGDSNGASWADFNGDGWLDLYVSNYPGISGTPGSDEIYNKLYRNDGDGTFTDVSVEQTVDDHGYTFVGQWFDYDRDGDQDLYTSNDRGHLPPLFRGNQLWRNDDGQMVNVSEESGADAALFSMGVACGDFDDNGYPDLYCTNIGNYDEGNNRLLMNQGDGTFLEQSEEAGVAQYVTSWGAAFYDFDNDTDKDLYVNNQFQPNMFHYNPGAWPCIELGQQLGVQSASSGFQFVSFTSAIGDVDNDGDQDLLVGTLEVDNIELFINQEGEKRNHVRFDVVGLHPNHFAVGANVEITADGLTQFQEIYASGNGYLGHNEMTVHFGLDDATIVESATVNWPGGAPTRTFTNIPINETWRIYPPSRLGDSDQNGVVTLGDFAAFKACYVEPFESGCEVMDFDGNFSIDGDDFAGFMDAYEGRVFDCDGNGVNDFEQIIAAAGTVKDPDANGDGLIDSCGTPACLADCSGNGVVDAADLNLILGNYGNASPGGDADVDGDGMTGFADLNLVLEEFGNLCE